MEADVVILCGIDGKLPGCFRRWNTSMKEERDIPQLRGDALCRRDAGERDVTGDCKKEGVVHVIAMLSPRRTYLFTRKHSLHPFKEPLCMLSHFPSILLRN